MPAAPLEDDPGGVRNHFKLSFGDSETVSFHPSPEDRTKTTQEKFGIFGFPRNKSSVCSACLVCSVGCNNTHFN